MIIGISCFINMKNVRFIRYYMLLLSILWLLSSNAVSMRRDKSILYARDSIIILILSFIIGLTSYHEEFYSKSLGLFNGLFHVTTTTHIFHLFIFIVCILILQLNAFYPRKINKSTSSSLLTQGHVNLVYYNSIILNKFSEQFRIIEYPLLILFVIIGGTFLVSSNDLISIFLAIELQSYGLYILCSVYRDSENATSAGLTYFLLGGLSSCFILLGSALLYGNSGNTMFDGFYIINNITNAVNNIQEQGLSDMSHTMGLDSFTSSFLNISLIIMSVGFLFKVTAAPFHSWSPDVYDAIPTVVTTFVAIFTKISIFILLLELVHYLGGIGSSTGLSVTSEDSGYSSYMFNFSWTFTLLVSSLISLVIGSVMGLTQSRIKRLYAYSTISHVGFILLALTINSVESIQSFLFYIMQYSLSNLNAFIILIAIGFSLYFYKEKNDSNGRVLDDKKNSPIQLVSQLKGYFYINPTLAISLSITIFSFVGVPPLIGFFAKQMVLSAALDNGYVFMAIIAILTSVISACYYLAVVKQIFFDKSDYTLNLELISNETSNKLSNDKQSGVHTPLNASFEELSGNNVSISGSLSITIASLTLMMLLFILNPQEWLSLTNILSLILFNC